METVTLIFIIRLADPALLAKSNLNASSWSPGVCGYGGATPGMTMTYELSLGCSQLC